eukprot:14385-Eustigmatos_ZCMA.PRE.1
MGLRGELAFLRSWARATQSIHGLCLCSCRESVCNLCLATSAIRSQARTPWPSLSLTPRFNDHWWVVLELPPFTVSTDARTLASR